MCVSSSLSGNTTGSSAMLCPVCGFTSGRRHVLSQLTTLGSCLSLKPPCSVPLKSTQPFKQDRRQFTYTEPVWSPGHHSTSFDFRNTESSSRSQLSHFLQPESSEPADFLSWVQVRHLLTNDPSLCGLFKPLPCVWLWEEWNGVLRDSQ